MTDGPLCKKSAESGQSALLKKCDEEYSGQPEHVKIKKLSKVLDKTREISIQESVYRILGLPLCKFSVKVSWISCHFPSS